MANYRVEIKRSAEKEIVGLPSATRVRVVARIAELAGDPRPPGAVKLTGAELYRIRQGDWRVVYLVDDDIVTVVVVRVGHRSQIYR